MTLVTRSLESLTDVYTIFEKDQVLTHDQLNKLTNYLDDHGRLTRIDLLGVGIVCGLRLSVSGNKVALTRGVGVTTDGDLMRIAENSAFDRFKAYGDTAPPAYPPLFPNQDVTVAMYQTWELVLEGKEDAAALPLGGFAAAAGKALDSMTGLLLMESYVKDNDLCTSTDCDNLGKDSINTIKLLLIDKDLAANLLEKIEVSANAYGEMQDIFADRVIVSKWTTTKDLVDAYRATCATINGKLAVQAKVLAEKVNLKDIADPAAVNAWSAKLVKLDQFFAVNEEGIQYYYDFLKDLVETFNAFRDALFSQRTVCCPDVNAFPKHLMLGNVSAADDAAVNRTRLYPSPLITLSSENVSHARHLAIKLSALIQAFNPGFGTGEIRITPSMMEDVPLEERAIPFYYKVDTPIAIHRSWNYRLVQRGMQAWNYGYHAALYRGQGAALNPLQAQIGRYCFFRIEGHLGQKVDAVQKSMEELIRKFNLPIKIRTLLLETKKEKIVKIPRIYYTPLHHLHNMLREDLFYQLDDVAKFSGTFKQQVFKAVETKEIVDNCLKSDTISVTQHVTKKHETVTTKAASTQSKLRKNYVDFEKDVSWRADLQDVLNTAGEFKSDLRTVAKTEFTTPFDSLIGRSHLRWIDWIGDIITTKNDKVDEKLMFPTFVDKNPGLEHFAGVSRGGTFILVYDVNQTVIADFMLPYCCCEEVEEEPEPKPLPPPVIFDPPFDKGITIKPSIPNIIKSKFDEFKVVTKPDWEKEVKDFKDHLTLDWKETVINLKKDLDDNVKINVKDLKDSIGPSIKAEIETFKAVSDAQVDKKISDARKGIDDDVKKGLKEVKDAIEPAITGKLDTFKVTNDATLEKKVTEVRIEALKESVNVVSKIGGVEKPAVTVPTRMVNDKFIDVQLRDAETKRMKMDIATEKLRDTTLSAENRTLLEAQLKDAEADISKSVLETTRYVVASGLDAKDADAVAAIEKLSASFGELKDPTLIAKTRTALDKIHNDLAAKPDLQKLVKRIITH